MYVPVQQVSMGKIVNSISTNASQILATMVVNAWMTLVPTDAIALVLVSVANIASYYQGLAHLKVMEWCWDVNISIVQVQASVSGIYMDLNVFVNLVSSEYHQIVPLTIVLQNLALMEALVPTSKTDMNVHVHLNGRVNKQYKFSFFASQIVYFLVLNIASIHNSTFKNAWIFTAYID